MDLGVHQKVPIFYLWAATVIKRNLFTVYCNQYIGSQKLIWQQWPQHTIEINVHLQLISYVQLLYSDISTDEIM